MMSIEYRAGCALKYPKIGVLHVDVRSTDCLVCQSVFWNGDVLQRLCDTAYNHCSGGAIGRVGDKLVVVLGARSVRVE